jgi:hypothetical protein
MVLETGWFRTLWGDFDTVISANPATYDGSTRHTKSAKSAAEDFAKAVFDRIEFIRTNGVCDVE